jgi:hypothetical protein
VTLPIRAAPANPHARQSDLAHGFSPIVKLPLDALSSDA